MMKRVRIYCLLFLAVLACPAQAAVFNTVRLDQSRLGFTATEMGVPVKGSFGRFSVRMVFDSGRPAVSHAAIEVELNSTDAGSTEADDLVTGPLWFDVKAHPRAHFVSDSIRGLGGNRFEATGSLTIKGHTHKMNIPFTCTVRGTNARLAGAFTLKRADYAVGEGDWADFGTVGNEVRINFHILAAARAATGK